MSTDDDDDLHPHKGTQSRNIGDVGYGRPPRKHRFKPGQSGNPRGRPKGRKSENQMLEELLSRMMTIREGNRVRKISLREVIYRGIAEEAVKKKNLKAASFLFDRSALLKSAQPEHRQLTEDDKTVLGAYAKKFLSAAHNEDGNDD
ncbi:hypothetical protein Nham_0815 [Nitrobacter hamburgensis X14]|uniref:DUF5681 domain-containing protein n=1 Tax=Nitrobacter hamburgensis (strain DSM 10229 / NCIMB 13809 / X14) TaxID=323097 RepID=Q1QQ06_NITHX|nr:DUF5681 domain-containing protein [Nitrobacter hamburgensis]ABE61691.1 hypothetical protein Nham_0815 [Nitrobacter hamburgensis X14]